MPKTKRHTAGQRPSAQQRDERGGVTSVTHELLGSTQPDRQREPKMPHERDESTPDAASAAPVAAPGNEVMRRAHDDVASGKQDTDRGPVLDRTYHDLRKQK